MSKKINASYIIKEIQEKIPLPQLRVGNNLLLQRYLRKCEKIEEIQSGINSTGYKKILDFGCGNGQNSIILTEMGYDLTGIEIVEHEYWKNIEAEFVIYDGKKLPFNSEEFDIIVVFGVLEHIGPTYPHPMSKFNQCQKERKDCLEGLLKIMKKDGLIFIFDFPNKFSPVEIFNEIFNLPNHHDSSDKVSLKTLRNLVSSVGFEILESSRTGVLPAFFDILSPSMKFFINKHHNTINKFDSGIDKVLGKVFGQSNFIAAKKS